MEHKCAWCGKDIHSEKAVTYTHDDKTVEYTCPGECEKQFDNSRGLEVK